MAKWTLILVAIAALCAGCSRPVQKANNTVNMPANNKPVVVKKSYQADYDRESRAAFDAQKAFFNVKGTPEEKEAFLVWTERMYAALKYVALHEKENGEGSTGGWSRISGENSIKSMKAGDWKNEGAAYLKDPRVTAAIDDWKKAVGQ
jgi:hypothetical protein